MDRETFEYICRDLGLHDKVRVSTVGGQERFGAAVCFDGYVLVISKHGRSAVTYDSIIVVDVQGFEEDDES